MFFGVGRAGHSEEKCSVCGSNFSEYNTGIVFIQFKGSPSMCEKCLCSKLFGKDFEYEEEFKRNMESKEIRRKAMEVNFRRSPLFDWVKSKIGG